MIKVLRRPQFRFGLLVLLPILAWYFMFAFRPVVNAFRMALIDYQLLDPANSPWVGLEHFRTIFTGYELFWLAVKNTALYAAIINVATIPTALMLGYCLANLGKGRSFYQWALFIPVVVSMAAVALLFRFILSRTGILNYLLELMHLPTSAFLSGSSTALPSLAAVAFWKGLGGNVVIFTAGLLAIPAELYDAALVDGANAWQTFWRVTIPLLSRTLTLVVILVTIGSLQAYTSAVLLTGGGPARHTYFISQFIVEEAFSHFRFGLASASAFVLFLVILVVTLVQFRLMRTEWEY